jgi:hypothetical protein
MFTNIFYFIASFLCDTLGYILYQKYVDSHWKGTAFLLYAIITGALVWFFIFKLQDRGQTLRVFIPIWSGGAAIFGYFLAGLSTKTPIKELLNIQAVFWVVMISLGIYFLNRV